MSRRRVIHLLEPEPNGEVGGADLHVLELASAQLKRGDYEPYVVINQSADFARRLAKSGVPFHPGHLRNQSLWQFCWTIRRLAKKLGASIVHSHGYESDYMSQLLRFMNHGWRTLPLVMTCHGWVEAKPRHRVKTLANFLCYKGGSGFLICSEQQRSRLRAHTKGAVFYVPNGVAPRQSSQSHPAEAFGLDPRRPIVGYVGRLSEEKRPCDFVDIAAQVARALPDVQFALAGSGPLREALEARANSQGLDGNLKLLGLVEDIHSLYDHLSLLVVPSSTETTSRVSIEAGMHGVPVVASRVGGLPEVVDDGVTGHLCRMGRVAEFAERIIELVSNPTERERMGAAAQRLMASKFGVERMRVDVERAYNALC